MDLHFFSVTYDIFLFTIWLWFVYVYLSEGNQRAVKFQPHLKPLYGNLVSSRSVMESALESVMEGSPKINDILILNYKVQ